MSETLGCDVGGLEGKHQENKQGRSLTGTTKAPRITVYCVCHCFLSLLKSAN